MIDSTDESDRARREHHQHGHCNRDLNHHAQLYRTAQRDRECWPERARRVKRKKYVINDRWAPPLQRLHLHGAMWKQNPWMGLLSVGHTLLKRVIKAPIEGNKYCDIFNVHQQR